MGQAEGFATEIINGETVPITLAIHVDDWHTDIFGKCTRHTIKRRKRFTIVVKSLDKPVVHGRTTGSYGRKNFRMLVSQAVGGPSAIRETCGIDTFRIHRIQFFRLF